MRWLRPDYQEPRFSRGAKPRTTEFGFDETVVAFTRDLEAFPKDPYEIPLVVERLLRAASHPMSAADLSRRFERSGKRIEARIDKALETLADFGRIATLPDGRYEILGVPTTIREAA